MLLAIAKNTFDRRPAALRHPIALMLRGAPVDRAFAVPGGFGRRVVAAEHIRESFRTKG
jgi:hypothetical protein